MSRENLLPLILSSPNSFSLLFCTMGIYNGYISPYSLEVLPNTRDKLRVWSRQSSIANIYMPIINGLSTLMGLYCYKLSQSKYYLIGSGLMLVLFPYTKLFMGKINELLATIEKKDDGFQLNAEDHDKVVNNMKKWVIRHRYRILISLFASFFFFLGKRQSVVQEVAKLAGKK